MPDIPVPRRGLHRWWVRRGILIGLVLLVLACALMIWGSIESLGPDIDDTGDDLQRYGLGAGLLGVVVYLDVLCQRVITRLTQIIALFTRDVPPMQVRGRGSQGSDVAPPVVELYRARERLEAED